MSVEWSWQSIGGSCCIVAILKENREIFQLYTTYSQNWIGKICHSCHPEKWVGIFLIQRKYFLQGHQNALFSLVSLPTPRFCSKPSSCLCGKEKERVSEVGGDRGRWAYYIPPTPICEIIIDEWQVTKRKVNIKNLGRQRCWHKNLVMSKTD